MWLKFISYIPTDALLHIPHYLKIDYLFCPQVNIYFLYFKYFYGFYSSLWLYLAKYVEQRSGKIIFYLK